MTEAAWEASHPASSSTTTCRSVFLAPPSQLVPSSKLKIKTAFNSPKQSSVASCCVNLRGHAKCQSPLIWRVPDDIYRTTGTAVQRMEQCSMPGARGIIVVCQEYFLSLWGACCAQTMTHSVRRWCLEFVHFFRTTTHLLRPDPDVERECIVLILGIGREVPRRWLASRIYYSVMKDQNMRQVSRYSRQGAST